MVKTPINEVKVKEVTKYILPSICSFCGNDLDMDSYRVEIEGEDNITLCSVCGENFCRIFGIVYDEEA